MPYILTVTLAAGVGGTGLGGLFGIFFKRKSAKTVSGLLSFAAGVMLAVVCLDLVPDAIENSRTTLVLTGTAFGFLLVFLLKNIPKRPPSPVPPTPAARVIVITYGKTLKEINPDKAN